MPTNRVLSVWRETRNVAVLSVTDERFVEELKRWAERKGYRVEEKKDGEES